MDFAFSPEQEELRRSFAKFLGDKCPLSLVKEWVKGEKGFSKNLWKEMGQLGWFGLMYEENYGGSGLTFLDLFMVMEEMGAALLPSPFFTSVILSGMLIREAVDYEGKDEDLRALIRGDKIFTLALLDERGQCDAENPGIEAVDEGGGSYRINGTRLLVPYAGAADEILFCAALKGGSDRLPTLFKVSSTLEGVSLTPLDAVACEKMFAVRFRDSVAGARSILGRAGKGHRCISWLLPKAAALKCGEMLGGLRRVLDMTVTYARERRQFGRPIGSLQIVQHHCADMAACLETSRLLAYQAAWLLSRGMSCDKEVAMAKAWCSGAYKKSTWIAHQVHGGMGFTEEYDLHLFYGHAKAAELSFGDPRFHRSIVADRMGI